MQLSRLGPYLSAGAVTLSLIFVGLEIRHNTVATRGATMQAISDANTDFRLQLALSPDYSDLVVRIFDRDRHKEFSPSEHMRLGLMITAFVGNLENVYLQHKEGLVPDSIFDSYGWNDDISRSPYFADCATGKAKGQPHPLPWRHNLGC